MYSFFHAWILIPFLSIYLKPIFSEKLRVSSNPDYGPYFGKVSLGFDVFNYEIISVNSYNGHLTVFDSRYFAAETFETNKFTSKKISNTEHNSVDESCPETTQFFFCNAFLICDLMFELICCKKNCVIFIKYESAFKVGHVFYSRHQLGGANFELISKFKDSQAASLLEDAVKSTLVDYKLMPKYVYASLRLFSNVKSTTKIHSYNIRRSFFLKPKEQMKEIFPVVVGWMKYYKPKKIMNPTLYDSKKKCFYNLDTCLQSCLSNMKVCDDNVIYCQLTELQFFCGNNYYAFQFDTQIFTPVNLVFYDSGLVNVEKNLITAKLPNLIISFGIGNAIILYYDTCNVKLIQNFKVVPFSVLNVWNMYSKVQYIKREDFTAIQTVLGNIILENTRTPILGLCVKNKNKNFPSIKKFNENLLNSLKLEYGVCGWDVINANSLISISYTDIKNFETVTITPTSMGQFQYKLSQKPPVSKNLPTEFTFEIFERVVQNVRVIQITCKHKEKNIFILKKFQGSQDILYYFTGIISKGLELIGSVEVNIRQLKDNFLPLDLSNKKQRLN